MTMQTFKRRHGLPGAHPATGTRPPSHPRRRQPQRWRSWRVLPWLLGALLGGMSALPCAAASPPAIEAPAMFFKTPALAAAERALMADDGPALTRALKSGADVNARAGEGQTLLMIAALAGKPAAVQALLAAGADTALRTPRGDTAVSLAIAGLARPGQDLAILSLLMEAEADPDVEGPDHRAVVFDFVDMHRCDLIRWWHSWGARLDRRNRDDQLPVELAAWLDDWDVAMCLLELGAPFDPPSRKPAQTLRWALQRADLDPRSPMAPFKRQAWAWLSARGQKLPPLRWAGEAATAAPGRSGSP